MTKRSDSGPARGRARRASALAACLLGAAALSGGCAVYERCPPTVFPATGEMRGDYAAMRVFYATDRADDRPDDPKRRYSGARSRRLSFGVAEVSIPAAHRCGVQERPGLFERWSPGEHMALLGVNPTATSASPAESEAYFASLRERVALSPRRELLVYVHGFNTRFAQAPLDHAQIVHDLGFDGVPVVYSWPSAGDFWGYLTDVSNAEWTVPYFADFLSELVARSGAERIHILGHSLGTRVVARGVSEYMSARSGEFIAALQRRIANGESPDEMSLRPFDQIVLVAGDLDAEIFERDYARSLVNAANRTTIYVSDKDEALGLSIRLHGYDRLGKGDLSVLTKDSLEQIEIVDATAFDATPFGHFYHMSSAPVMRDLAAVLASGAGPQRRERSENYFVLTAADAQPPATR